MSRQTRVRFLIFSYVIILICLFQSPYQSQTDCSIMPRVSSWLVTKAILFDLGFSGHFGIRSRYWGRFPTSVFAFRFGILTHWKITPHYFHKYLRWDLKTCRLILLIHDFSLVIGFGGKLTTLWISLVVKYVHLTRLWIKINRLAGYKMIVSFGSSAGL